MRIIARNVRWLAAAAWLALCGMAVPASPLHAQTLPLSTTPRGVLFAFLTETATGVDSIDRGAFRSRLAGDMLRADPRSFKGLLPQGAHARIDSIPDLGSDADGRRRVAAYVTIDNGNDRDNWYIFCTGDSVWRLESLRRFPTPMQKLQIRQTLATLDTAVAADNLVRADLDRALLPDDTLRQLFRPARGDIEKLLGTLRNSKQWAGFTLREVNFARLEEYRELDDDIPESDLIFYTLDRTVLERVKQTIGLRRIERDKHYPGLIFLVIASVEKGSIGYVNAPDAELLPRLWSDGFIMIKPVAEGWWLYKRLE